MCYHHPEPQLSRNESPSDTDEDIPELISDDEAEEYPSESNDVVIYENPEYESFYHLHELFEYNYTKTCGVCNLCLYEIAEELEKYVDTENNRFSFASLLSTHFAAPLTILNYDCHYMGGFCSSRSIGQICEINYPEIKRIMVLPDNRCRLCACYNSIQDIYSYSESWKSFAKEMCAKIHRGISEEIPIGVLERIKTKYNIDCDTLNVCDHMQKEWLYDQLGFSPNLSILDYIITGFITFQIREQEVFSGIRN
ncbi:hypothetical protein TetV_022 [Tetraselmis virus 1]|uniref:Uncharacterized protein n=1 Tax=Tetraselmis virus 1 TaxID=2060617 RepID=A0A2P0VMJ6_9VIRU|nr:hypothetical protein QJ968_gp022 [Tetraselmis virus 1]AUF82114.1 hypothetical protein TetV_022 [Tetraselmis virus 1]